MTTYVDLGQRGLVFRIIRVDMENTHFCNNNFAGKLQQSDKVIFSVNMFIHIVPSEIMKIYIESYLKRGNNQFMVNKYSDNWALSYMIIYKAKLIWVIFLSHDTLI